jgi:L-lactate dehydrogenase
MAECGDYTVAKNECVRDPRRRIIMKVGIVGLGNVGTATAMAIAMRSRISELVLVNRHRGRAKGVATDLRYGLALTHGMSVVDGEYADLEGASTVIITAGINEKAGGATDRNDPSGRLRLLAPNIEVYRQIVPQIVKASSGAVLVVATDPPEPLAEATRRMAPEMRVMSTGTYLDSLRFRVHIAHRLGVSAPSVDAYVVGEHGMSSVFLWSSATVGGRRVGEIAAERGVDFTELRNFVEKAVRDANISIIEGTGASQYGIGMVNARISDAIVGDERVVFPAGAYNARYGTTLSLPGVIGRHGVSDVVMPDMSPDEAAALARSAGILKDAVDQYDAS